MREEFKRDDAKASNFDIVQLGPKANNQKKIPGVVTVLSVSTKTSPLLPVLDRFIYSVKHLAGNITFRENGSVEEERKFMMKHAEQRNTSSSNQNVLDPM